MDDKTLAMLGDMDAQDRIIEREELLPCPCCGGTPKITVQKAEYGLSGTIIRCERCRLSLYSPDKKTETIMGEIKNIPIKNHKILGIVTWDTRAPILAPEQIKRLEGVE